MRNRNIDELNVSDIWPFYGKFDPATIHWTTDWHINHKNMCRGVSTWDKGYRDFDTLEEMNNAIIDSCNDNVPYDHYLVYVGDMLFGDKSLLPSFRSRIKCQNIFYIYGNHCKFLRLNKRFQSLFTWTGDYLELFVGRKLIVNGHYPWKVWNESHRKSYAVTGHSHGNLPYTENERGVDAAWDTFKRPITFYELDDMMRKKRWVAVDHHNERTY